MTPEEEEEIFGQLPPIDEWFLKQEKNEASAALFGAALDETYILQLGKVMFYEILPHINKSS